MAIHFYVFGSEKDSQRQDASSSVLFLGKHRDSLIRALLDNRTKCSGPSWRVCSAQKDPFCFFSGTEMDTWQLCRTPSLALLVAGDWIGHGDLARASQSGGLPWGLAVLRELGAHAKYIFSSPWQPCTMMKCVGK